MDKVYWTYETFVGDEIAVSIRGYKEAIDSDFYHFFGKFISNFSHRIKLITQPSKLMNGSMVAIIKMHGKDLINFENKLY